MADEQEVTAWIIDVATPSRPLFLWTAQRFPRTGDLLHVSDGLPRKSLGWYRVIRTSWKPIIDKSNKGPKALPSTFVMIEVEKRN